jgi:hypothetical protein
LAFTCRSGYTLLGDAANSFFCDINSVRRFIGLNSLAAFGAGFLARQRKFSLSFLAKAIQSGCLIH